MYEQITYDYWCTLGGLDGPQGHRLLSRQEPDGSYPGRAYVTGD